MLCLSRFVRRVFLGDLDIDWLGPLREGCVGMNRNIFLTTVLRGSLLQLIHLFQGETSLFFEESSVVAASETVLSIPLHTGTWETYQMSALCVDVVVF